MRTIERRKKKKKKNARLENVMNVGTFFFLFFSFFFLLRNVGPRDKLRKGHDRFARVALVVHGVPVSVYNNAAVRVNIL